MWTISRRLARAPFREFDQRGPVLIELNGSASELPQLADDYRSFGGSLRALLLPRHRGGRDVVEVEVDYASWQLTVGILPEPLTREFYRPLRRLERGGTVATCMASIESVSARRSTVPVAYNLWLNPAA